MPLKRTAPRYVMSVTYQKKLYKYFCGIRFRCATKEDLKFFQTSSDYHVYSNAMEGAEDSSFVMYRLYRVSYNVRYASFQRLCVLK